jgi:hypothetical protein
VGDRKRTLRRYLSIHAARPPRWFTVIARSATTFSVLAWIRGVEASPRQAALYATKAADLQAANHTAIRAESAESLGSLIEKVVLTPIPRLTAWPSNCTAIWR